MVRTGFVVVASLANGGAANLCASHPAPRFGDRLQTTAFKDVEIYSWLTPRGPVSLSREVRTETKAKRESSRLSAFFPVWASSRLRSLDGPPGSWSFGAISTKGTR